MIYAIIIISLSLALSIYVTRSLFAPSTIVSALWLFCILAYQFYPHNLFQLKTQFYTGISIWVAVFTFFSLFTQGIYQKPRHINEPSLKIRNFYFAITLISFPIILWSVLSLLKSESLSGNIYTDLRALAIGSNVDSAKGTSKNYLAPLWLVAYSIELLHYRRNRLWILLVLFAVNFSWALLTVAKSDFLNLFVASLAILYFRKVISARSILISLAVIFIFFSSLQIMRAKEAELNGEELAYDFFTQYVLSGMPAFETIRPGSSDYFGEESFRTYYTVKNRLGISKREGADALQKFIPVDSKKKNYTNVYTVIFPYYKDFGNTGIVLFAILLGISFGYIYKQKMLNNSPMTIFIAILSTGLILEFMSEQHITALSFIIQVLVISHIPYWLTQKTLQSSGTSNA